MLTLIEDDVPEFLLKRDSAAYCSQLHVKKVKSSLILSRNLKFYEFRKKEMVHHIDLKGTYLQRLSDRLESYSGPISSFLIRDDVADISGEATSYSMLHAVEELPLSIGKYVWLGEHIYVLLRCWLTLVVLRRPDELGANFELVAQHDNLQDYRLVRAPTKYQALVELQFNNGKRKRTNFQNAESEIVQAACSSSNSTLDFQRLMRRVHSARAVLHTQRVQTHQDFLHAQEQQAFGVPGQRSPLLEEKQVLRRCGDVWTRICADSLVVGTLLTNSTGNSRPTMLHALRPLVQLPNGSGLNLVYRLYELPLQPDGQPPEDYDELAQFWACQSQFSTSLSWRPSSCANQLPPERSAVLLLSLQLADLLTIEHIQLLALYELQQNANTRRQQLQLQLASINVTALLQQQELHVPSFAAHTLHQDFLAVIMAQTAHCVLRLQFQSLEQQSQFEQLLTNELKFAVINVSNRNQEKEDAPLFAGNSPAHDFDFINDSTNNSSCASSTQRIFFNYQTQVLLLRKDVSQLWHIYCSNETQLCLLVRRLMRDLLQLECNLSLLEVHEEICSVPANAALLLESALRDELQARAELLQMQPAQVQHNADNLKHLHQLEMASDLLLTVIKTQPQLESS